MHACQAQPLPVSSAQLAWFAQQNSDYFPSPPYYQGHFSNGPIWLETAAASLSDVLHSYAAGAAVTGAPGTASNLLVYPPYADITSVVDVAVPTGLQQVFSVVVFNKQGRCRR